MSYSETAESLKVAIQNGRTDIVRSVISTYEQEDPKGLSKLLASSCTEHGTLLHLAIHLNKPDIVRALLAAGMVSHILDKKNSFSGQSILEMAQVHSMQTVFVEELLKAVAQSNITSIKSLLSAGVGVNATDNAESENTPLHWAASYANKETCLCLLDNKAEVNAINSHGATPLHDAVHRGNEDVVQELVAHGADPNIRASRGSFSGKSAMDLAAANQKLVSILSKANRRRSRGPSVSSTESNNRSEVRSNSTVGSPPPCLSNGDSFECDEMNAAISEAGKLGNGDSAVPVLPFLWPVPEVVQPLPTQPLTLPRSFGVEIIAPVACTFVSVHDIEKVWQIHESYIASRGWTVRVDGVRTVCSSALRAHLVCHVNPYLFKCEQSYKILINSRQISLSAGGLAGLHFAIATLTQILGSSCCNEGEIPCLKISDRPKMKYRGVLFDLSQDARKPKLEALIRTLDALVQFKINQVHLYIRFSCAKSDVWQGFYSPRELLELERYCRERCVTLVPAIDIEDDVSYAELSALSGTFDAFLAFFHSSSFVHVGSNLATLVFGRGDDEQRPLSFPDFRWLLPLPAELTLMTPSSALLHPDHQVADIHNVIPLDYVTNLIENKFSASHSDCVLGSCVSSSSVKTLAGGDFRKWSSIEGSSRHHLASVLALWKDSIPLLHHDLCLPTFLTWASSVWTGGRQVSATEISEILNVHILMDETKTLGRVIVEMNETEMALVRTSDQSSPLYQLLADPDLLNLDQLSLDSFVRTLRRLKRCQSLLPTDLTDRRDANRIRSLQVTLELMHLAAKIGKSLFSMGQNPTSTSPGLSAINPGISNLYSTTRTDVANKLLALCTDVHQVWCKDHSEKGLRPTTLRLHSLLSQLIPDTDYADGILWDSGPNDADSGENSMNLP